MAGSWSQIDPRLRGDGDYDEEDDGYEDEEPHGQETRLGYNPQIDSSHYDRQLDHDRCAKKQLLQRRFEHIFEKYGRDFEGVGDEIEMETGLIVVDNGHLKNMQHEGDPGYPDAAEFANPPVDNLDPALGGDVDQNMTADSGSEGESEDGLDEQPRNDVFSARGRSDESNTTPFETEDSAAELGRMFAIDPALDNGQSTGSLRLTRSRTKKRKRMTEETDAEDDREINAEPQDISKHLESLKASMLHLQSKHQQGQGVNNNDIEALGLSIARQLADFVSGDSNPSQAKWHSAKDPTWSYPELPRVHHEQVQQRPPRSPTPLPLFTGPSPGQKSLWAPIQHPKPRKKYKRRKGKPEPEADLEADREVDKEPSPVPDNDENAGDDEAETCEVITRTCTNCECMDSLIWRTGPDGDLCNACGMYYYRYGLIRPLAPSSDGEGSYLDDESDVDPEDRHTADDAIAGDSTNAISVTTSNLLGRGRFRGDRFKMEEDAKIIKLKEIDRLSWERIAKHFAARTAYGVQCRYSKKLSNRPVEARAYLVNQGYESRHDANGIIIFAPAPQQAQGWTEEEDDLLLKLRDEDKLEWDTIAESFPGRNARAMERRFSHLVRRLTKTKQSTTRPKKKPKKRKDPLTRMFTKYTTEEDDQLIYLREVEKLSWADIALKLPGRNAMAMQKRYVRELAYRNQELGADPLVEDENGNLRPTRSKQSRFTREEDYALLHMRNDLGLGWKEIEFKMPGRKWQSLENRYQYITKGFTRYEKRRDTGAATGAATATQTKNTAEADGAQSEDELVQDKEDQSSIAPCAGPSIPANAQSGPGIVPSKEIAANQDQSPQGHGFFSEGDIPFTTEEDSRIRQLRELKKLSWDAIAIELPGRNVAAISARYYRHLFPRSESVNPWSQANPVTSFDGAKPLEIASRINLASNGIASKRTLRWTKEESDMVLRYYNQGLDFEDIGERMPWRSHKAIQHYYTTKLATKKSTGKLVAPSFRNSLLRQAVGNTARQSLPAQSTLSSVIDLTGDDGDDESPSRRTQRQSHESKHSLRRLLPRPAPGDEHGRMLRKYAPDLCSPPRVRSAPVLSPLPHAHPSKTPGVEAYASLLSQYLAGRNSPSFDQDGSAPLANPLTPSRSQQTLQPLSTATADRTASNINYFTPSTHNLHAHPYFVPPPVAAETRRVPLFSEHGLSTQRSVIDPRLLEETFAAPPLPLQLSRIVPDPILSAQAAPVSIPDESTSDNAFEQEMDKVDDDPMFIDLTAPDPSLFLDDDDYHFDDKPAETYASDEELTPEELAHDSDEAFAPSLNESTTALTADNIVEKLSTNDALSAVDLFETDETSASFDEAVDVADPDAADNDVDEFEDDKSEPSAPVEDADPDDQTEILSPVADHGSMHDSGFFDGPGDSAKDVEVTQSEIDDRADTSEQDLPIGTPPPHSWEELLLMAFENNGSRPMNVRDIYKFIEGRFSYYQNNTSAWKDGVQACLDEKPEFVKVSRSRPLWVFKKALQHEESEAISQLQSNVSEAEPDPEAVPEKVVEHVRLITSKSLRERPPKPVQAGQVKRGRGRPRKAELKEVDTDVDPSTVTQDQAGEVAITVSDDEDELAPSPDKIAAQRARTRVSSLLPTLSNDLERLHAHHELNRTSDINMDSASGFQASITRNNFLNATNDAQESMSEVSKVASSILNSSSPMIAMKTPGTAYGKTDTPDTSHSTLIGRGRPQHRGVAALRSSMAPEFVFSRSSSVALPNSRKRVVYTPVRDVEGDEDELG